MAYKHNTVEYGFGQMGSVFNNTVSAITPPTGKVFVAITMLADTVFDATGGLIADTTENATGTNAQVEEAGGGYIRYALGNFEVGYQERYHAPAITDKISFLMKYPFFLRPYLFDFLLPSSLFPLSCLQYSHSHKGKMNLRPKDIIKSLKVYATTNSG